MPRVLLLAVSIPGESRACQPVWLGITPCGHWAVLYFCKKSSYFKILVYPELELFLFLPQPYLYLLFPVPAFPTEGTGQHTVLPWERSCRGGHATNTASLVGTAACRGAQRATTPCYNLGRTSGSCSQWNKHNCWWCVVFGAWHAGIFVLLLTWTAPFGGGHRTLCLFPVAWGWAKEHINKCVSDAELKGWVWSCLWGSLRVHVENLQPDERRAVCATCHMWRENTQLDPEGSFMGSNKGG